MSAPIYGAPPLDPRVDRKAPGRLAARPPTGPWVTPTLVDVTQAAGWPTFRYRFGPGGRIEFEGEVTDAESGDHVCTIAAGIDSLLGVDQTVSYTVVDTSGVLSAAAYKIDATTGDVTVFPLSTPTVEAQIDLRNPTAGAFYGPTLLAVGGITISAWGMLDTYDSAISGAIPAPPAFNSLAVRVVMRAPSGGDVRFRVGTKAVSDGNTVAGGFTAEATQTITVGANAKMVRFPASGSLATGVAPGDLILVQLARLASSDSLDTLAGALTVLGAWLEVS